MGCEKKLLTNSMVAHLKMEAYLDSPVFFARLLVWCVIMCGEIFISLLPASGMATNRQFAN